MSTVTKRGLNQRAAVGVTRTLAGRWPRALLIGEPVTVASHDATMKSVATELGLKVTDPVER